MNKFKIYFLLLISIISIIIIAGCTAPKATDNGGGGGTTSSSSSAGTAPTVVSTTPTNLAASIDPAGNITATFSVAMDPSTITAATFTLTQGVTPVACAVSYVGLIATLNPTVDLQRGKLYSATITTGAKSLATGTALAVNYSWTFTTAAGQAAVTLGAAGNYVILAKSAISTTGTTSIVGDIGLSPAAASFISGFGLVVDGTGTFSTSSLVSGRVYASDYTPPTPANMTTAIADMMTAYTDAAGRTIPDFTDDGAGNIGGLTLAPGLYKWTTGVTIPTDVTLNGGPNDTWIFQISGTLSIASAKKVLLTGGAQAKNIFWQTTGAVTLNTTSQFQGIVLSQTAITMTTGATITGRLFAQTAVITDTNTITHP